MQYWVYILRCSDDSLYCGITTDLERRVSEHNGEAGADRGRGARYTYVRRPVSLVYSELHADRSQASKEERRIKSLSRTQKELMIQEHCTS